VTAREERGKIATPWRDNVEALAMAIIMALLLKYFIVEAYKIPSGSMQPTLIGDEKSQIFDRILVDKLSFRFRDPERFEVVVFKYPLDLSKNFVKRVVGIGPEDIQIQGGDLWRRRDATEPWGILRRPRAVQRETWKRLDLERPETSSWYPDQEGLTWEFAGRRVAAHGPGRARFGEGRGPIMDAYLDGYPDALIDLVKRKPGMGVHPVGDVRVDGQVEVGADTQYVGVELYEGVRRFLCLLPGPAAPADARPCLRETLTTRWSDQQETSEHLADAPLRLEAGRSYRFGAQNLDDLLELELDGDVVLSVEIANTSDQRASAYLVLQGGPEARAEFDDLMAYRDIYYTEGDLNEYNVPEGHYFMLGDNTQDSSDGREWKLARLERPTPGGGFEVLSGNARRDDDAWQQNPWQGRSGDEQLARVRFRDLFGETWWLEGPGVPYADPPAENAPYVPRRLIQGRALAVFWPLSPRLGVYRWKWVR
jgi:signal peptidase I